MNIEKKVEKFRKKVLRTFTFEKYELQILDATLISLRQFYIASGQLENEGITTISKNGMQRKHPACEVQKVAWANFLSGIKTLKLQEMLTAENKRRPGRPLEGRI